jgi:glycine cleavage system regulatory protein
MDLQEITRRLQDRGCAIARSQVNQRGRFVYLIQPWNIAMFQEDIADILSGRATLDEIIDRNTGADLADHWPVA